MAQTYPNVLLGGPVHPEATKPPLPPKPAAAILYRKYKVGEKGQERTLRIGDVVWLWPFSSGKHDIPKPLMVCYIHEDGAVNGTEINTGYVGWADRVGYSPEKKMGFWTFRD